MNEFLKRQLREALAPLEAMLRRLVRDLALGIAAMLGLIACLAFLTVAAYLWLCGLIGAILAALCIALAYLLVSLAAIAAMRGGRGTPAKPEPLAGSVEAEAARLAAQAEAELRSDHIDSAFAPLLAALQQAGLPKASLAVLLGTEIAKQVRPLLLVAVAFVAGLVFGRRT